MQAYSNYCDKPNTFFRNKFSIKLESTYPYNIWQGFYGDPDSVTEINEEQEIFLGQNNFFIYNVLFQRKNTDCIIKLKNYHSKLLVSNTIFDSNSGSKNIYQDGGSCVQFQICVKNCINIDHSEVTVSENSLNFIIESSLVSSEWKTSAIDSSNGQIYLNKINISNTRIIPDSRFTLALAYYLNGPQPNANVSFSTFSKNNFKVGLSYTNFMFHRLFHGFAHHLIISSNSISCDDSGPRLILINSGIHSNLTITECNIISNSVKYLFYASTNSYLKESNCYIVSNTIEKSASSTEAGSFEIKSNRNNPIEIDNSVAGYELCNGDPFAIHNFIMINISIENLNYPIIEYDEDITANVFFKHLSLITNIYIETWLDEESYDKSKRSIQSRIISTKDDNITFSHSLSNVFGSHRLYAVFRSETQTSDVVSISFLRRNRATIKVTESFSIGNKIVFNVFIEPSEGSNFKHCEFHLSFNNETYSTSLFISSSKFGISSDIPDYFDYHMHPILLLLTNERGHILCETYHKINSKGNIEKNEKKCIPMMLSRRR